MQTAAAASIKTVTQNGLSKVLGDLGEMSVMATICVRSDMRQSMRKQDNPFLENGVFCRKIQRGFVGLKYSEVVNKQRKVEGKKDADEFQAAKLWNGKAQKLSRFLVKHTGTGKIYLIFHPVTDDKGKPLGGRTQYEDAAGELLDAQEVQKYFYERKVAKKNSTGTKKAIVWRTVKLDSLMNIKIKRETYWLRKPGELVSEAIERIQGGGI